MASRPHRHSLWLLAALLCSIGAAAAEPAAAATRIVIGESVRGRPLTATVRGPASETERVLVFGSIHGDEAAGIHVVRRLDRAAPPRGAALWLVPSLNPDGVATGTRGNAHGVDLNRNFPVAWRPLGGLEYSGPGPLSEPESRAAARLIRRLRPDVTIWFHQPFGLVDRSGGAPAIERRYADLVGLPLVELGPYPGSATRWQNRALHRGSAFVVELPAVVSGRLIGRAARAVIQLAREYAGATVAGARAAA